jgi:hypothetical protein
LGWPDGKEPSFGLRMSEIFAYGLCPEGCEHLAFDSFDEEVKKLQGFKMCSDILERITKTEQYFKIQDPDGYTNMRDAPSGNIIRKVFPNEKFRVSAESGKYKVVIFDNGETGYIHSSRVFEY